MPRYRSSRWILILVVLVLLGGAGLGAFYVIRRGMKKEGLYEQAVRAMREGRPDDAERHLRTLLQSAPDNTAARARLISLLADERKIPEAEKEIEKWLEDPDAPAAARRLYCELAFRGWRLDLAEARARAMIEEDPVFAYGALLRAREARGTLPDLLEAIRLAINLTIVTDEAPAQVSSWIFAAETMIDLLPAIPEGQREKRAEAAQQWLRLASRMLEVAAKDRGFPRDVALARIQVLSAKPEDRALGEEGLRLALTREPRDHLSRASLAKYLIREGRLDEALTLAKELREGPYTLWRGVMLAFALRDHREQSLALLEDPPIPEDPLVSVIKAQFLMQAEDPEERARGVALLVALRDSPAFGVTLAARAFAILSGAGETEAARSVIEAALARESDPRLEALLLASTAVGSPDVAAAAEQAAQLADQAGEFDRSLQILSILRPAGREAVARFLDAQISKGHDEARHRLLRAAVHLQRSQREEEDRDEARRSAATDLEALLSLKADRGTLAAGARLALLADLPEVAGSLYASGLREEPVVDALSSELVRRALVTDEAEVRARVATGIRKLARTGTPDPFLDALADAVEQGKEGIPAFVAKLRGMTSEPGIGPRALVMLMQLAGLGFDAGADSADLARQLCDARPDDMTARILLGEYLRTGEKWDALYECWAGRETDTPAARDQWVIALWMRGDKKEALASAQEFAASRPADPQAASLLARVHALADDLASALAVLGAAPPSAAGRALQARVLTRRALLRQQNEGADPAERRRAWDEAEGAWRALLWDFGANRVYWDALIEVLSAQGRRDDMINVLTDAVTSLAGQDTGPARLLARDLLLRRAMLQEQAGRTDAALIDYAQVIQEDQPPSNFIARNNAAWIIQAEYPARIAEAVRYIEEALALRPDVESLHDTAAMVYLRAGDHDRALEQADAAVAAASRPGLMRTRAIVLERIGRKDDADAQWRALLDAFPDSPEAVEAHARVSGPAGG